MTIKSKMLLRHVGRRDYTVTSYTAGSYVNGRWVEGTSSTSTVKGHEQPSGPRELQQLPDSFRTKDVRLFMTTSNLKTLDESGGTSPDKVEIDGVQFECHKKKSYQMGPRQHYEIILVRLEQSAGGVDRNGGFEQYSVLGGEAYLTTSSGAYQVIS